MLIHGKCLSCEEVWMYADTSIRALAYSRYIYPFMFLWHVSPSLIRSLLIDLLPASTSISFHLQQRPGSRHCRPAIVCREADLPAETPAVAAYALRSCNAFITAPTISRHRGDSSSLDAFSCCVFIGPFLSFLGPPIPQRSPSSSA
jgi:hypothetical protein